MLIIIRIDTRRARIAYVSTIADMMIPFVLCSGFFAVMPTLAAAVLPWIIPEISPTIAIGRHATRKLQP